MTISRNSYTSDKSLDMAIDEFTVEDGLDEKIEELKKECDLLNKNWYQLTHPEINNVAYILNEGHKIARRFGDEYIPFEDAGSSNTNNFLYKLGIGREPTKEWYDRIVEIISDEDDFDEDL